MSDFVVVKQHPQMLLYIDDLQRKNAESLSFYPTQVFEREQKNGRLFLGMLNGEPCGYLYVGATGGDVKCHQVCIQYDARRRLYGKALVIALEDYAKKSGSLSVTLRCGFDLDANDFWKDCGYTCIAVQPGGIRRNRKINVWRKYLQPTLFEIDEVEPAKGKTSAKLWAKHKETGIVTQFSRGKKLEEYRLKIERQDDETTKSRPTDGLPPS